MSQSLYRIIIIISSHITPRLLFKSLITSTSASVGKILTVGLVPRSLSRSWSIGSRVHPIATCKSLLKCYMYYTYVIYHIYNANVYYCRTVLRSICRYHQTAGLRIILNSYSNATRECMDRKNIISIQKKNRRGKTLSSLTSRKFVIYRYLQMIGFSRSRKILNLNYFYHWHRHSW